MKVAYVHFAYRCAAACLAGQGWTAGTDDTRSPEVSSDTVFSGLNWGEVTEKKITDI